MTTIICFTVLIAVNMVLTSFGTNPPVVGPFYYVLLVLATIDTILRIRTYQQTKGIIRDISESVELKRSLR